ncbi:hypothetical protein BDZ45DRAFT_734403 [Acephala macrosclerotiorum]|nr:hypothetical protein BDZ45DRAFT_734403 [Acephala macrosclerotiorum]
MYTSISQLMAITFLALPIISALEGSASIDFERRYVGSNAVMASIIARNSDLLPSRDLSLRHHTEAQIAAKKAKAASTRDAEELEIREPHHTEAQIAAKKAKASARGVDTVEAREAHHKSTKREAHHTEAQIAAKKAKASNLSS